MDETPPTRHAWTAWLPTIVGGLAIISYAVVIALEVGTMRGDIRLAASRIDKLEQQGSGPVQQSAERVTQIQTRVDRILSELLDMQKRVSDIAVIQARESERVERLRGDKDGR